MTHPSRPPRIGSLFSGYGGLDLGVMSVLGGEVVWHVEFDDAPSRILAHHWPDKPNYGDVATVDWATVEPVDVLTGGFPCQDVSPAGKRAGLKDGTRSGLWSEFAKAIDALRPHLVVIENVRGLLSAAADSDMEPCPWCLGDNEGEPCLRALGAVLGDLADLGYDTRWIGLRAADAGAPHGRFRVFIVAYPEGQPWRFRERDVRTGSGTFGGEQDSGGRFDADTAHNGHERPRASWSGRAGSSDGGPSVTDASRHDSERWRGDRELVGPERTRSFDGEQRERDGHATSNSGGPDWGEYAAAIRRWERVIERVAPAPTSPDGRNGAHRLNSAFVEWMMGLDSGHVTQIGLTRAQQLKALGNGVVPQQAALALRLLLATKTKEQA